ILQWLSLSRLVKILSTTDDVYLFPASGLQSFTRHNPFGQGGLPRNDGVCRLECNRLMALWTTTQCRTDIPYHLKRGPGMSVIPFAPIQSPY
ncbi:MAG: hypothetical protein VX867_05680, partial [Pseudomonadota bacterium]|nr:hypothetical protein [Pseudomonadota bacterium]